MLFCQKKKKHVALVGELSRLVENNALLKVGESEQSLAYINQHATDLKSRLDLMANPLLQGTGKLNRVYRQRSKVNLGNVKLVAFSTIVDCGYLRGNIVLTSGSVQRSCG